MRNIAIFLLLFVNLFSSELKIATYNVENLFDGVNNGNEYPDFKIGKSNWNNAQYLKKISNITDVIKSLDADIIALQEIENEGVIKKLAGMSGYENYAFSISKNSPFGVGILSKIKFVGTKEFNIKEIKTRNILRADFEIEGAQFSLFTTHFLSMANSERDRKINAKFLARSVDGAKNAIILGDFNSEYSPRSLLEPMVKEQNLVNLWKFIGARDRSSHISGRAIDHILLGEWFFDNGNLSYKDGSFGVFKSRLNKSDHSPVYFTLVIDPKKPAKMDDKSDKKIEISEEIEISSIDEIYGKEIKTPVKLSGAVVTYKDKNGYVLSKENRGIYIFDRQNSPKIGDVVDVKMSESGHFYGNYQISRIEILKTHPNRVDPKEYMMELSSINAARSGDMIKNIVGDVKNGKIRTKWGEFLIYGKNKKIPNGDNQKFESGYYVFFKGQRELVVE